MPRMKCAPICFAITATTALCLTALTTSPRAQDASLLQAADPPVDGVWLDTLDLRNVQLRPAPRPQRGQTPPPRVFTLGGVTYPHALPLRADADMTIDLSGGAVRFMSMIGIEDGPPPTAAPGPSAASAPPGSVVFGAWADGKKVFESDVMKRGDAAKLVSIDLTGVRTLVLAAVDANDGTAGDNALWAGAIVITRGSAQTKLQTVVRPREQAPRIAASRSAAPMINYPRITGATPGRPFLFRIPASGDGPLTFTAKNLPAGLTLDAKTGIISGALARAGRTDVQVRVRNDKGQMSSTVVTIVGGDHSLALTPPLGWNSWNVWGGAVTDAHIRAAADGMVRTGLIGQGYTYINIDDAWEGPRGADGEITSNEKFPDMKALAGYVHSNGLKIGIYSSPGSRTCQQRYAGSYQHEEQDAKTWARWGFDYIKYDWCSYSDIEPLASRAPLEALQKPYTMMRGILDTLDRDFVYSLCQYGWGRVWEWGAAAGGNLWRVTGDINDNWWSMSSIGFQQTGHERFSGPGHWNDTDMLVVGHLGWGRTTPPRQTSLTPNEQLTHISLWALQAAPMLIGADMSQMDGWTVDLLGNREVLAINQDPLGRAAGRVWADNWTQIWARELSDGTMAIGLFNRAPEAMPVTVKFADVGLKGPQRVRDPWTHTDASGDANDSYTATVPRHGVVLLRTASGKSGRMM
jgi:alpha-galactosidase